MNDDENKNTNINETETKYEIKPPAQRRIPDISKRGEAFWESLVTMIIEGIVVNLFSLPIGAVVAFVIFTTSEGGEITVLDSIAYAVTKAALFVPVLVIITNLFVVLCEKSNEHERAMKTFNAVIYVLYPVISLGVVAAYWMFR